MPKKVISEEEVSLPQVKKILSKRSKDGELSFQQTITLEHANMFSRMAPSVSIKTVERLMKNYALSRAQAVQLVNIAPNTEEEMKTVLDTRKTDLTDDQIAEIVEIIQKARS